MATITLTICDVCRRKEDEVPIRSYPVGTEPINEVHNPEYAQPAVIKRADLCAYCAAMILHDVMNRFDTPETQWMGQRIQEVAKV